MGKKLYYKIGEACKRLEIQPYVLRYWETEFPFLSPDKSRSGQRVYDERELVVIRRIKELLYEEGYTIAGAKKKIEAELVAGGPQPDGAAAAGPAAGGPAPGAADTRPAPGTPAPGKPAPKKPRRAKAAAGQKTKTEAAAELDSAAQEKVEKLRAGVETALHQTRAILELLGSEAS